MNRIIDAFGEQVVMLYLLCAGACAFVMSLLRSVYLESRKSFKVRLCEAFMCSMLASAVTMLAHLHLGLSYSYAMPIGTIIGYLGADFISAVLIGWLKYKRLGFPDEQTRSMPSNGDESRPQGSDNGGANAKPDNPDRD